jgi:hypothetical protein
VLHLTDESGLILKHPIHRLHDELLGILPAGRGHLLKPRFNIRREMYFHRLKSRDAG